MLTIRPNLLNSYNKTQSFGNYLPAATDIEDVDYEAIYDDDTDSFVKNDTSDFEDSMDDSSSYYDYKKEGAEAKKDLDLWKQAKQNIDSIAKTTESVTESVPAVKTGMKICSGLISVAIGWGGLRWGSVGTLEVLSKLGQTKLAKAFKGYGESSVELLGKGKKLITNAGWYKSLGTKIDDWEAAFLKTGLGSTLSGWKNAITSNSKYIRMVDSKNNAVQYIKNLNPKRIFVETMGVAGGGTAAVNTLGGKSVDGVKQKVEVDENGNYLVNGKVAIETKGDYSNVA